MNGQTEPGYLRTSWRIFAFALPKFVFAFLVVRYASEWVTSASNADFLRWAGGRWPFDLCAVLAAAIFEALTIGYRKWLGPSYVEWRRAQRDD